MIDEKTNKRIQTGGGGAIFASVISNMVWPGDLTAQCLLAIIGFGFVYLWVREI